MDARRRVIDLKRTLFSLNPNQLRKLTKELDEKKSTKLSNDDERLEYADTLATSILTEEDEEKSDFLLTDFERIIDEILKDKVPKSNKVVEPEFSAKVPSVFRKDFKIHGTISDTGGLSYISLKRQITTGLAKGHTDHEILEGVIRAMQPGSRLRHYVEGRDSLPVAELKDILQSYFKEQTPTELYKKLCNLSQNHNETETEFLMRSLDLKQKVIAASAEEDQIPYDVKLVEKMFIHALQTGIRDDNIRHRLRPVLQPGVEDTTILKQLNEIILNEHEHCVKVKSKGKVSSLHSDETIKTLQDEITNLKTQVQQLQVNKTPKCFGLLSMLDG